MRIVLFTMVIILSLSSLFQSRAYAEDSIPEGLESFVIKNILAKLSYERIVYSNGGCGTTDCISQLIDCDKSYDLYFISRPDFRLDSNISVFEYRGYGNAYQTVNGEHFISVIPSLTHFHRQVQYRGLIGLSPNGRIWLISGMMHLDPIKCFFWSTKRPSSDQLMRYIKVRYFNYDLTNFRKEGVKVRAYSNAISQDVVFKIGKHHDSKDVIHFEGLQGRWRKRVE